jgi:hypothetical protein
MYDMNSNQIIILQGYLNLFWHFPINTLTAQPGISNLIARSSLKFCPTIINLIPEMLKCWSWVKLKDSDQ